MARDDVEGVCRCSAASQRLHARVASCLHGYHCQPRGGRCRITSRWYCARTRAMPPARDTRRQRDGEGGSCAGEMGEARETVRERETEGKL